MPEKSESQVRRSGRLFAAVAVLRLLAKPEVRLPGPDAFQGKDSPAERIDALRSNPYDALLRARERGGRHWEAATAVLLSIPELLKDGPLPYSDCISRVELKDFTDGYDDQLAAYREKFAALLP
ncbi:hypothetical protein [Streptomyces sp. NPDC127190]|uniref:hypothetical protein n=1 Tax=unclassified Streptomyces TaxID=2593676 RepID=UPI00362F677E